MQAVFYSARWPDVLQRVSEGIVARRTNPVFLSNVQQLRADGWL